MKQAHNVEKFTKVRKAEEAEERNERIHDDDGN